DRISVITDRLKAEERITFTSLFADLRDADRHRLVPTFLAVLEMARLKLIKVHQSERHTAIYLSRTDALDSPGEGVSLDYREGPRASARDQAGRAGVAGSDAHRAAAAQGGRALRHPRARPAGARSALLRRREAARPADARRGHPVRRRRFAKDD